MRQFREAHREFPEEIEMRTLTLTFLFVSATLLPGRFLSLNQNNAGHMGLDVPDRSARQFGSDNHGALHSTIGNARMNRRA
jgi:hypothetical protein